MSPSTEVTGRFRCPDGTGQRTQSTFCRVRGIVNDDELAIAPHHWIDQHGVMLTVVTMAM